MTSLTKSALSGVAWNFAGSGVIAIMQIASAAVTARLIDQAQFGAYASAQAALTLASYFTVSTIGLGILRRSGLSEKTAGTAVAVSIGTAALVLAAMLLLASLWAHAWGIPEAASLVRVLGFALFFTSLSAVPLALLRRRLRFAAPAVAETVTQIGGITVSILLALLLHSALALAIGQLAAGVALCVWAIGLARREIRIRFDLREARELFAYGSQLSGLYLGFYGAYTLPYWVAGRSYGAATLGLYSRSSLIIALPLTYVTSGISKVLFPLYGRIRDDAARIRALIGEALVLTTGFGWPLMAIVAGGAPVIIDALLGPSWHDATPLLRLTALIGCAQLPTGLLTNAAEAIGWIRITTLRLTVFIVLVCVSIGVTQIAGLGLQALLAGLAVAEWTSYGITLEPFVTRKALDRKLLLRSQLIHAAVSVGAFTCTYLGAVALEGTAILARVVVEGAIALVLCGIILTGRSWFPATKVLTERMGGSLRPRNRLIRRSLESSQ
jgi:O-antigen/teichoic acid export membrane protein